MTWSCTTDQGQRWSMWMPWVGILSMSARWVYLRRTSSSHSNCKTRRRRLSLPWSKGPLTRVWKRTMWCRMSDCIGEPCWGSGCTSNCQVYFSSKASWWCKTVGYERCTDLIKQTYWFFNMRRFVRKYVMTCVPELSKHKCEDLIYIKTLCGVNMTLIIILQQY